jgi:glycosyltransferase involved in cell wall biosynthesis
MSFDPLRWAVVGFHDFTGLGGQARDLKRLLGVRHLVATSDRLEPLPLEPGRDFPLPLTLGQGELDALLSRFDGLILLEKPDWHPALVARAKARGLAVAGFVNWEWFRGQEPAWRMADLLVCSTPFAVKAVRRYGYSRTALLPWPVDLARFSCRKITGPARTFFHNGGLIDDDDRKGTRDTITAFMRVRDASLRLIVRLQKPFSLPAHDARVEVRIGNLPDPAALYAEGEAAIQPSKMEGCGLNVLEPVLCGLPVITTDYPPMNEHVTDRRLLVRPRWFRRSAFPARAAGIRHAHLRLPDPRDLARKIVWCAQHDLAEISRANRTRAETQFNPVLIQAAWSAALGALRL